MRNFKAWWRTALNSPKDRRRPRNNADSTETGSEHRTVEAKDHMASLLNAEPPTHTLQ